MWPRLENEYKACKLEWEPWLSRCLLKQLSSSNDNLTFCVFIAVKATLILLHLTTLSGWTGVFSFFLFSQNFVPDLLILSFKNTQGFPTWVNEASCSCFRTLIWNRVWSLHSCPVFLISIRSDPVQFQELEVPDEGKYLKKKLGLQLEELLFFWILYFWKTFRGVLFY